MSVGCSRSGQCINIFSDALSVAGAAWPYGVLGCWSRLSDLFWNATARRRTGARCGNASTSALWARRRAGYILVTLRRRRKCYHFPKRQMLNQSAALPHLLISPPSVKTWSKKFGSFKKTSKITVYHGRKMPGVVSLIPVLIALHCWFEGWDSSVFLVSS